MIKLYLKLYQKNIFSLLIITLLVCWSISMSVLAFRNQTKILILQVTEDGVFDVSSDENKLDNIFLINFLRAYVGYCYNYDVNSFDKNMSRCSDMMSEKLWNTKKEQISRAVNELKSDKVSYTTSLDKALSKPDGSFELNITTTRFYSGGTSDAKVKLTLQITKTKRSVQNPWGYEVQNVQEDII